MIGVANFDLDIQAETFKIMESVPCLSNFWELPKIGNPIGSV